MFDINNHKFISRVINMRDENAYVIPLYVKVYNDTYSILELQDMKDYNPASFKIGFGSSTSLFAKKSFPSQYAFDFDTVALYSEHDEDTGSATRFIVFETSDVDPSISEFHQQLHAYYEMLSKHINEHVTQYKKEALRQYMEENS